MAGLDHKPLGNPLQNLLQSQGVVILDGALATELERRGAHIQDDPLWSARLLMEAPELIRRLHYDYFVAGADVTISASYQATFPGFAKQGFSTDQAAHLMELSVQLAVQAREAFWSQRHDHIHDHRQRPLVAASIGCYGAYLADGSEYRGDYGLGVADLMDFHRDRMALLVHSEADLLACETIPCLVEAEALLLLLAEFPWARAWLSFSCCDGTRVCHGEEFRRCVALANRSPQIVAVGLNCTSPAHVESLLRSAAGVTAKPLLAYPNSGEIWDPRRRCWVAGTGTQSFSESAVRWYRAGARLIGGCCRTGPEDIGGIRERLREEGVPPRGQ